MICKQMTRRAPAFGAKNHAGSTGCAAQVRFGFSEVPFRGGASSSASSSPKWRSRRPEDRVRLGEGVIEGPIQTGGQLGNRVRLTIQPRRGKGVVFRGQARQAGSSCLCSATRNFSLLLGFIEGSGLNLSL